MGVVRDRLDQAAWRQRGFDLSPAEVGAVERFFERWLAVYNRPGIGAYRSQEGLFATHEGLLELFGEQLLRKERRNAVSVLRAGYCIAVAERDLLMRTAPDPNLSELFRVMAEDDGLTRLTPLAAAQQRGHRLAEVASKIASEQPDTAKSFPGFGLREAIFADLRTTLFVKLKVTGLSVRLDDAQGEEAMRHGHIVAVCEEALPETTPPVTAA